MTRYSTEEYVGLMVASVAIGIMTVPLPTSGSVVCVLLMHLAYALIRKGARQ